MNKSDGMKAVKYLVVTLLAVGAMAFSFLSGYNWDNKKIKNSETKVFNGEVNKSGDSTQRILRHSTKLDVSRGRLVNVFTVTNNLCHDLNKPTEICLPVAEETIEVTCDLDAVKCKTRAIRSGKIN